MCIQRHVANGAQISASVGDQILVRALSHLCLGPNTLLQHREGVLAPPAPLTPSITPLPWTHISNTLATHQQHISNTSRTSRTSHTFTLDPVSSSSYQTLSLSLTLSLSHTHAHTYTRTYTHKHKPETLNPKP